MRISDVLLTFTALSSTAHAAAIPGDIKSVSLRSIVAELVQPVPGNQLEKRKGGGGKGGSSSSSSSSGSRGSGSDSSSSGSSSSGRTSSSSNSGGSTASGSGVKPSYGSNGAYYAGGSTTPYKAGTRSPGGVTPYLVGGAALGLGGAYAYGYYLYPYPHSYSFHNQSSPNNSTNTTLPVTCTCEQYNVCGCDNTTSSDYLDQVIGNGSASDMNTTIARVENVNGTTTLLINGTLANGTTASGGSDSAAGSLSRGLVELSGWWIVVGGVAYTVWFM
ncbi:hypothetical protein BDV97DRAFT_367333 [Delphinella strobiligena]|nr:hypothetical protein BDV97DRAFT_367333 [Delphinella strobiligena]